MSAGLWVSAELGVSAGHCAGVFDTNSAHAFRWMEDPMSGWMTGRQCSADDVSELLLQGDLDQRVRSVSVATTLRRYPGTCTVGPGVLKLPATVGLQLMVTSAQRAEIPRIRGTAVIPSLRVIYLAIACRSTAPGKTTRAVATDDELAKAFGHSVSGAAAATEHSGDGIGDKLAHRDRHGRIGEDLAKIGGIDLGTRDRGVSDSVDHRRGKVGQGVTSVRGVSSVIGCLARDSDTSCCLAHRRKHHIQANLGCDTAEHQSGQGLSSAFPC